MKRIIFFSLAVFLLAGFGCSRKSIGSCEDCNASADTIVVRIKHKASAFRCCTESVPVYFDKVTEESRCPMGVYCIWSGTAKIDVIIGNGADDIELQLGQLKTISYGTHDYMLRLIGLTPYPVINKTINPNDYEATIVVSR